jgi:single-strand DNA-binding protein
MDNTVTIVGNCTREPELRFTASGQAVTGFGIAVNRRFGKGDQAKEETSFFDVTAWGTLGENVAESIQKGARVIITGRLEQQTWEKDGDKKSKVQIVADAIGPELRFATAVVSRTERTGAPAKPAADTDW